MSATSRASSGLSDEALIARLQTDEDRLPREVVEQVISRGSQMVEPLTWLAMDSAAWHAGGRARWGAIHATFLLGAIGSEASVLGLLAAADNAEASDCRLALDALPAIFARLGASARPCLWERVRDTKRGARSRSHMAQCLAATTLSETEESDTVFAELGEVFAGEEDQVLKAAIGMVLLDFKRVEHRDALVAHAEAASRRSRAEGEAHALTVEAVERAFAPNARPDLAEYRADWLGFYGSGGVLDQEGRRTEGDAGTAVEVELHKKGHPDHVGETVPSRPKVRRTARCPCGSGKKYKDCCLELEAALGPLNDLF